MTFERRSVVSLIEQEIWSLVVGRWFLVLGDMALPCNALLDVLPPVLKQVLKPPIARDMADAMPREITTEVVTTNTGCDLGGSAFIPYLVFKTRFDKVARAGGLCPCSPTLEGAGLVALKQRNKK